MKSFLFIATLTIAISIGCTYKSSGSQSAPANNSTIQSASTNATQSQEKQPCTMTLAAAPDISGFKLGMTADEVLALFPGSKEDAEVKSDLARPLGKFGTSSFLIRPPKYENKEKFAGISQVSFSLLDGHVSKFTVQYSGPQYSHVDKFVAKVVEGTNLPSADQWETYVGMDNQVKTLTCTDFDVRVFAGGPGGNLNNVSMRDLEAKKKLDKREAKAAEESSPSP